MPSRFHVLTQKPFDQYDKAGIPAVLSAAGFYAIQEKKPHLIAFQAEELEDGTLRCDDDGLVVAAAVRGGVSPLIGKDGHLVPDWKEIAKKAARVKAPEPTKNRMAAGANATRG